MDTKSDKRIDFGKGSITLLILKQSIPLILAQFAQLIYSIEDRVFIGHIPNTGKTELTGLGICFPIITLIMAFTLLFGLGGTPLFSIARGERKNEEAKDILSHSFILLTVSSLILIIVSFVIMRPLLFALGASENTFYYAKEYLSIYILGTPFLMIGTGLNFYISALGKPKTAMLTTLSGAIVNTILDPIFIFCFNLGIKGAAIATLISQIISFLWVIRFFLLGKPEIGIDLKNFIFSFRTVIKILKMGITNFVMEATNCAIQVICNRTLSFYGGDDYVMLMTVINSVRSIMGLIVSGLMSGSQPVLGYNYGAKEYKRVLQGIRVNSIIGLIYTALAWIVVVLFPGFFISLFCDDINIINIGTQYLRIYFTGYIFMSLQFSAQSTFMALGKAKPAIFFSVLRKIIIVIPLTLILAAFMTNHISGVFWAEPISNVVGGISSFTTMYFMIYRKLKKHTTLNESAMCRI